jgi:hypothetical protein
VLRIPTADDWDRELVLGIEGIIDDDHVMKNDAAPPDGAQGLSIPKTTRIRDNGKPSLKHAKCSFNVFSLGFLPHSKVSTHFALRLGEGFHEDRELRVDTVYQEVHIRIHSAIDFKAKARRSPFEQSGHEG